MARLKILLTLGWGALSSLIATAQPTDSVVVEHVLQQRGYLSTATDAQPALYAGNYQRNYASLQLTGEHRGQTAPILWGNGTSNMQISASADAYLHLSRTSTVWGSAGYDQGKTEHVQWNAVADFERLLPYIMADSVGGNRQTEHYHFSGGYGAKWKKWRFGAQLGFQAEQSYQERDPRMRSIVNEIGIQLSLSHTWHDYLLTPGIAWMRYKQSGDVSFYNPLGAIDEYHLTGLGNYYQRFTGQNTSVSYQQQQALFSLDFSPISQYGWYAHGEFSTQKTENILRSLNALPLSRRYQKQYRTHLGYRFRQSGIEEIYVGYTRQTTSGDENIVGDATSNIYPSLLFLTLYHAQNTNYYLGAQARYKRWTLAYQTEWQSRKENYAVPHRAQTLRHWRQNLQILYAFITPRHLAWRFQAGIGHALNTHASLHLPKTTEQQPTYRMVQDQYRQLSANRLLGQLSIRCQHPIKQTRYGLFYQLSGNVQHLSTQIWWWQNSLAVGFTF